LEGTEGQTGIRRKSAKKSARASLGWGLIGLGADKVKETLLRRNKLKP